MWTFLDRCWVKKRFVRTTRPSVCRPPNAHRLPFAIDFPDLERNDPRTENRDRILGRRRRLHALPDPPGRLRDRLLPRPLRLAPVVAPRRLSRSELESPHART